MIIQVVLGQIGEGTDTQPGPVHAALLQPMAGRFHRQVRDTIARQRVECAVQRYSIRRGVAGGFHRVAAGYAQRAQTGRIQSGCGPDLAQKFHARTFAIGAGNRDNVVGLLRIELRGQLGQDGRRIVRNQDRNIQPFDRDISQDYSGPLPDRLGNEVTAMRLHTRQRSEQEARLNLPAVQGQAAHLDVPVFRRELIVRHQRGQFQGIISGIRAARTRAARSPWSLSARSTPRMGPMRDTMRPTAGAAVHPPVA